MARIRDSAVTIYAADNVTAVCSMPIHAAGDLLLCIAGKDGTAAINTPANWFASSAAASTGAYGAVFTKRAQSATETLSLTTATTDAWTVVVISIEGQYWDGSTQNGSDALSVATTLAAEDSTSPYTAGTITPAHSNSLIISALYSDATFSIHPSAGWPIIFTGDSGTNSLSVCYTQQKTAAAITGPTWTPGTGAVDDTRTWMIAIRDNASSNLFDAYLDRGTTPSFLLSRLNGSATGDINTPAYIAAASTQLTSVLVNGSTSKTCTGVTWGTAVTDSAYDPYGTTSLQSGASSITNFSLSECTFNAWNLTQGAGLVFGIYHCALPRDYVDLSTVDRGGVAINFTSGTTANARAWCIGGQFDATTSQGDYTPFVVQVQQTNNTAYAWNGTVTWNNITRVGFLTQGYYGAAALRWHGFHVLNKAVLAGGHPSNPFGFNSIGYVVNRGSGNIPLVKQAGSAITTMMPLQFGGGDPCAVSVNLSTIQFPTSTITDSDYRNFHVDPDYVGVEFYGKTSSDSFKFTNTVFTGATSYYWKFNASHSASAVLDFSGSSVINATVGLQSTSNLSGLSFIGCGRITSAGCTLTSTSFVSTRDSLGAYYITSASQAGLQSALDKLSSCTFKSNTLGPALVLNYTGSATAVALSMSSGTFTGNTTDIRWEAPASSPLTISLTGGANPGTYSSTNSNTVTFSQSNAFAITNIAFNSEVRIFRVSDEVELAGVESIGTSGATNGSVSGPDINGRYTFTYTHAFTSTPVFIVIVGDNSADIKYQVYRQENYTLTNSTQSLLVTQLLERNFSNP